MLTVRDRRWLVAAAAVFAAAIALRCLGLRDGYWIDEVISVETARLSFSELLQRVGFLDVHPPLYYLSLSVFKSTVGPGEVGTRLFSLAFGALSLVLVFAWGWRKGRFAAFLALLMMSVSAFHAHYSIEVRPYALLVALSAGFLLALERVTDEREPSAWHWAAVALLEVALLMTQYSAAILVVAANAYVYTCRPLGLRRVIRWSLVQAVSLAAQSLWLPFLLVQYLHLPPGMFAHLSMPDALHQTVLAFGLAPVHPSSVVAWFSAFLVLAAALWGVAAGARRARPAAVRETARPEAGPRPGWRVDLTRVEFVCAAASVGLVAAGPLITVGAVDVSDATLPLILDVLPYAYGILAVSVLLLAAGAAVNVRGLRTGHGLPAAVFLFPACIVLFVIAYVGGKGILPRNTIWMLPLVCQLAAVEFQPRRATAMAAVLALVLGVAVPSVLRQRSAFEPRQDFRAAAEVIGQANRDSATGSAVFVLPMWDRPGVEHYLGHGTANGIMSVPQLPRPEMLPGVVSLVLTRSALEQRRSIIQAAQQRLGAGFRLRQNVSLRMAAVAVFQRSQ